MANLEEAACVPGAGLRGQFESRGHVIDCLDLTFLLGILQPRRANG